MDWSFDVCNISAFAHRTRWAHISKSSRLTMLQEIAQFFSGLPCAPIAERQITLAVGVDGRSTGEAYVAFGGDEEKAHKQALETLNRSMMGSRYIELFPATQDEIHRAKATSSAGAQKGRGSQHQQYHYGGLGLVEEDAVVRLRGLPFSATVSDVVTFFEAAAAEGEEIRLHEKGVHFVAPYAGCESIASARPIARSYRIATDL
eukprot:SAG11_NODE_1459_length_4872_cov_4.776660_6_plen_204_part_00